MTRLAEIILLSVGLVILGLGGCKSTAHGQDFPFFVLDPATGSLSDPCDFQPSILTNGNIFWYDSEYYVTNTSDISPPANSDNIKTWGDRSTNHWTLTNYANSNFRYETGYLNSKPGLGVVDNSGRIGSMDHSYAQPFTIFVVGKTVPFTSPNGSFSPFVNSTNDANFSIFHYKDGAYAKLWLSEVSVSAPMETDKTMVFTVIANGANTVVRTNGVFCSSSDGGTAPLAGLLLGWYRWSEPSYGGAFMKYTSIIGYKGIVSSNDCRQVEAYLCCKYGIQLN